MISQIAQAIADELNAGSFSQEFTAERLYLPLFELQEMKALHVSVVPRGVKITKQDRSRCCYEVQIDIAVQKKVPVEDNEEIDSLMALVQEIASFLKQRRMTGMPGAVWTRMENNPVYAPDHLHEYRQFTSLLTITYTVTV